jgi:hypothetical protein
VGKTDGVDASSIAVEGMSYENAHSDGYGGGVLRLHIIGTAFDASSSSSGPGGSGHAGGSGISRHAGFGCDARYARSSGYAGCACGSGDSRGTSVGRACLGLDALGRWASGGLLRSAHSLE